MVPEGMVETDVVIDTPVTERKFKHVTLANGLQVLAISDSKTQKAAAAMSCKVGQLDDPDAVPGLAHFTEHMLFLGTEKYPHEGEYQSYVTTNSGSLNAFTALENTCFIFSVGASKLDGALDRFAQFFVKPLFTESATGREIMAVESEHQRSLTEESFHFYHSFLKELLNKEHPFSRFGAGNQKTLLTIPERDGINTRQHLIDFQAKHYKVKNLRLCVYGKDDCDTLLEQVKGKFDDIPTGPADEPSNHQTQPWRGVSVFDNSAYGKVYYVKSVSEVSRLTLIWETGVSYAQYLGQPAAYVSHLIGHECEGSILHCLKDKGWATGLVAGTGMEIDQTKALFNIVLDLTAEGLQNMHEIVEIVFEYIAVIKKAGFSEAVFKEVKDEAQVWFRHSEVPDPFSLVSHCASAMNKYPPQHILSGECTVFEKDIAGITALFDALTPNTAVISVGRPNFPAGSIPVELDRDTPFFKKQYGVWEIPSDLMAKWCAIDGSHAEQYGLCLPAVNVFVPDNFDLHSSDEADLPDPEFPTRVWTNRNATPFTRIGGPAEMEVWHWKDITYKVPKAYLTLNLSSPAMLGVKSQVLCMLYVEILDEYTTSLTYFASMANIPLSFSNTASGISIATGGFDQRLPVLLEKILCSINGITSLDDERGRSLFETRKQRMLQRLRNYNKKQAVGHASDLITLVTQSPAYPVPEMHDVCRHLTVADLNTFIKDFRSKLVLTFFAAGNITKAKALEVATQIPQWFDVSHSFVPPSGSMTFNRVHELPKGKNLIVPLVGYNPENKTSVVVHSVQIGLYSPFNSACLLVFNKLVSHIFFYTLRTVEQMGYAVHTSPTRTETTQGFEFMIQSAVCDPWYAYSRMWWFLHALDDWIDAVTQAEFEQILAAAIELAKDKPKTLQNCAAIWWYHIESRTNRFDSVDRRVAALKELTIDQFKAFYREHISNTSPHKRSLTSFVYSNTEKQRAMHASLTARWGEANSPTAPTSSSPFLKERRKLDKKVDLVQQEGGSNEGKPTGDASSPLQTCGNKKDNRLLTISVSDGDSEQEVDVTYVMRYDELKAIMPLFPKGNSCLANL